MKTILIEARWLGKTGIGRYVENLLVNLARLENSKPPDQRYHYLILTTPEGEQCLPSLPENFKIIITKISWFGFKEQISLAVWLFKQKIDLIHYPNFNVPILYWIFSRTQKVVTIHDLILLEFDTLPNNKLITKIKYKLKNYVMRLVIWVAVKFSNQIICCSNFVAKQVKDKYHPKYPVKAIHLGLGVTFKENEMAPLKTLDKLGVEKSFILYVGNAYPHKNLPRLILAFSKLITKYKLDLQLVIVGKLDKFKEDLLSAITTEKLNQRVIFTDHIGDQVLKTLYDQATIYCLPSLSEGFGLQTLESFAHNLPLVCSRASCLPEIAGEAAIYFDPKNINDMAEKMSKVITNDGLQKELIIKGRQQLAKFDFSKTAETTYQVYQDLLK